MQRSPEQKEQKESVPRQCSGPSPPCSENRKKRKLGLARAPSWGNPFCATRTYSRSRLSCFHSSRDQKSMQKRERGARNMYSSRTDNPGVICKTLMNGSAYTVRKWCTSRLGFLEYIDVAVGTVWNRRKIEKSVWNNLRCGTRSRLSKLADYRFLISHRERTRSQLCR